MRYGKILLNDTANAPGINVTFFVQGCPHRCLGCHNPETWDFSGGKEFTPETLQQIIDALKANGVERNFCIMGGEPLCKENAFLTHLVASEVKKYYPNIKIYIWTGYTYDQLIQMNEHRINEILSLTDVLIDGPYIEAERDITLKMRGSKNQCIIFLDKQQKI